MSLYSLSPEPTSASKVPLRDLLLRANFTAHVITNTPDDAGRIQRIKTNGLACLGRLHRDVMWDDWLVVGAALEIITAEALAEVGAFKWDANNKQAVKAFNARWEEYEAGAGTNRAPLSKQERWALREIMRNPEISAWRGTLTATEKRRLNYPKAVLNRFQAQARAKATPAEDRKPSPYAQQKATNIELQEDLHRLKQRGDGNAFTHKDSPKAIATAIIGTFDGLSNKRTKVEAIGRALCDWAKQDKMAAE